MHEQGPTQHACSEVWRPMHEQGPTQHACSEDWRPSPSLSFLFCGCSKWPPMFRVKVGVRVTPQYGLG